MGLVKKKLPEPAHAAAVRPIEQLMAELEASDPAQRLSAARELGGHPAARPALLARFGRETHHAVRDAIGTALLDESSAELADGLAQHLSADDAGVRNAARELLLLLPDSEQCGRRLLGHPDPDVRMFGIEIVAARAAGAAADVLCDLLDEEPDVNVRAHALEQLGELGELRHVTVLDELAERSQDEDFLKFSLESARKRILSRTCNVSEPQG